LPETGVALHPVFELQVTVPVMPDAGTAGTDDDFLWFKLRLLTGVPLITSPLRRTTRPYSPSMVAVNVTCWPRVEGFWLEPTDVLEVACVMLKLLLCVLLEPV
jgi:hypothetical protein